VLFEVHKTKKVGILKG